MAQTFKQLPVDTTFEFASRSDSRFLCSGMESGPWRKCSVRQYTPVDKDHRLYGFLLSVGSINVAVVEL